MAKKEGEVEEDSGPVRDRTCCVMCLGLVGALLAVVAIGFLVFTFVAKSSCVSEADGKEYHNLELLALTGKARCEYDFAFGLVTTKYSGELLGGQLHGSGVYEADGHVYRGSFLFNTRFGEGVLTMENGIVFSGHWKKNMVTGSSSVTFPTTVKEGLVNSLTMAGIQGGRYDGAWEKGCFEGEGHVRLPDGLTYNGTFADCIPTGSGALALKDGSVFKMTVTSFNDTTGILMAVAKSPVVSYVLNCSLSASLTPAHILISVGTDAAYEEYIKNMAGDGKKDASGYVPKSTPGIPCDNSECAALNEAMQRVIHVGNAVTHTRRVIARSLDYTWVPAGMYPNVVTQLIPKEKHHGGKIHAEKDKTVADAAPSKGEL